MSILLELIFSALRLMFLLVWPFVKWILIITVVYTVIKLTIDTIKDFHKKR